MTQKKVQLLTIAAVSGWLLAIMVPAVARHWLSVEVLILMDMVVLSAAITSTILAVVVRALPPVAAAWFLGYREASKEPERDDGRKLRAI